ncbi:MAG: NRDE family protein [Verrucomicrobiota bacterium]
MCTVTWWSGADGYELYFSRDELKSRLPGIAPSEEVLDGVRYLAPSDGNAGGTWLWVNAYGLSVCILNQYPEGLPEPGPDMISRGLLVRSLACAQDAASITSRLRAMPLARYAPFQLIALEAGGAGVVYTWHGRELRVQENAREQLPFTSSSYLSDEIVQHRRDKFAAVIAEKGDMSRDDLVDFHHAHDAGQGAHSVFMQRDDAETVSFSQVVVKGDQAMLTYADKIPGQAAFAAPLVLRLKLNRNCLA